MKAIASKPSSPISERTPVLAIEQRMVVVLTLWVLGAFLFSYFGIVAAWPLPVFGLIVTVLLTSLITLYFRHAAFRRYIDQQWTLKHLMVFHVWRIVAGAMFIYYGSQGLLPTTFATLAGYGDILAGLMVPIVLIGGGTPKGYLWFNIIGFLDFIVAVGTGLTLTLTGDTGMSLIATLPLSLIPLFGVPVSGVSHIMALDRMLRGRRTKTTDSRD